MIFQLPNLLRDDFFIGLEELGKCISICSISINIDMNVNII